MPDDPITEMQDLIEEKIRDTLLAHAGLAAVQVLYRGEPEIVPVRLHPFGVVFLESVAEATGQDGYGGSTAMRYYRFDGYVSFEVLHRDATGLAPGPDRKADVPSYMASKDLTKAAQAAIIAWAGTDGRRIAESPVTSSDGQAETVELRTDRTRYGLNRRANNVSNTGLFEFHCYVRVLDFA